MTRPKADHVLSKKKKKTTGLYRFLFLLYILQSQKQTKAPISSSSSNIKKITAKRATMGGGPRTPSENSRNTNGQIEKNTAKMLF